eukprot:491339-Ditylum_brightwellii.AAC.1
MAFSPYFALALCLVVDNDPRSLHLFHFFVDRVFNERGDIDYKVSREGKKEYKELVVDQMKDSIE